jgi:hypothetical protein
MKKSYYASAPAFPSSGGGPEVLTPDQEQRAQKTIADFLFNDPNSRASARKTQSSPWWCLPTTTARTVKIRSVSGEDRRKTSGRGGGL